MKNKNLISTERTSGMSLEPGVNAHNVEAVVAFRQLPQPFTIPNLMKANHTVWLLGSSINVVVGFVAEGERRENINLSPQQLSAYMNNNQEDNCDDNGVLATCYGAYFAHQLHVIIFRN